MSHYLKKFVGIILSFMFIHGNLFAQEAAIIDISFGVYQSDKASEMHQKFKPLANHLSLEVSRLLDSPAKVRLKIYASYQDALNAIIEGEVDFVRFGPASYILAKEKQPGIRLLAIEEKKGKTRFKGLIVVLNDSPIQTLSDLKGHSFAFGNENSTIGRYLAQSELLLEGVNSSLLTKSAFLGRHDKVFKAIELGDFDAGSLKESTFKKMNKNKQLRVVHSFENVTKPWVARAGLQPVIFSALSTSLIKLSNVKLLKRYKVSGFLHVDDEQYQYVRDHMQRSKRF